MADPLSGQLGAVPPCDHGGQASRADQQGHQSGTGAVTDMAEEKFVPNYGLFSAHTDTL